MILDSSPSAGKVDSIHAIGRIENGVEGSRTATANAGHRLGIVRVSVELRRRWTIASNAERVEMSLREAS